jgi:hypothetical protein
LSSSLGYNRSRRVPCAFRLSCCFWSIHTCRCCRRFVLVCCAKSLVYLTVLGCTVCLGDRWVLVLVLTIFGGTFSKWILNWIVPIFFFFLHLWNIMVKVCYWFALVKAKRIKSAECISKRIVGISEKLKLVWKYSAYIMLKIMKINESNLL